MTIFRAFFWLSAVTLFMPATAERELARATSANHITLYPFHETPNASFVSTLQLFALKRIQQLKDERAIVRLLKESRDPQT